MNTYHYNDLSYSLLYSAAIRGRTSRDDLEFLDGCRFGGLNNLTVNHMDEALLQTSDLVCEWLLNHSISCSQLGMDQLVDLARKTNDTVYWKRVERLLNHPVCAHLRLQQLLPSKSDIHLQVVVPVQVSMDE
jgi:hypothetical protein